MNRVTCVSIALCAAFVFIDPARAVTTIYQDPFSYGSGTEMDGMRVGVGFNNWDTTSSMVINGSQQMGLTGQQTAFLPLLPHDGQIYSLSVDINSTGTDPIGLGFATNKDAIYSNPFVNTGTYAWLWANPDGSTADFTGPAYNGVQWGTPVGGSLHNYRIDLNTMGGAGNWTASYYTDGVIHNYGGVTAFPVNLAAGDVLRGVEFGGVGAGTSGYVDNFQLTTSATPSFHIDIAATGSKNIYTPPATPSGYWTEGYIGYRYGCTSFIDPATPSHIMQWASSEPRDPTKWGEPPDKTWDCIRYRTSFNGGNTWTEGIVLEPTAGGNDAGSCCDPGVIKIGSYYYLGYTGDAAPGGMNNKVFIARSTSPSSGFKKWTGSSWVTGGNPAAVVANTDPTTWGAGCPEFVLKDSTLYVYYAYSESDGIGLTRVSTISLTDINAHPNNWPSLLTYVGQAAIPNSGEGVSSVKYIPSLGKFIAVGTDRTISPDSAIQVWESTDGIHFDSYQEIAPGGNVQDWACNATISGRSDGTIVLTDPNFISYAYSSQPQPNWGWWYTYYNRITIGSGGMMMSQMNSVPEPGTLSLVCAGAVALLPVWRRWRKGRERA